MKLKLSIQCVSPLFLHGADMNATEIRVPSIRGQLRDWFRMLGGTPDEEQAVFGGMHGGDNRKEPVASRVVLRVDRTTGTSQPFATLPHKENEKQRSKAAWKNGLDNASFDLLVSSRLTPMPPVSEAAFLRSLKAWLLLGGLGQRCTRGGGSLKWSGWTEFPYPDNPAQYREAIRSVVGDAPIRADVLDHGFPDEKEARKVITNTLGGPFPCHPQDGSDLASLDEPLGFVQKQSRKVSTLKMTVRKIGRQFFIVAVWDGRERVTGNRASDLRGVIDVLANHPKPIGELLRESSLYS